MRTTRRNFLKIGTLAGAAAAVPVAMLEKVVPSTAAEPIPVPHKPEMWKTSVCDACGAGCGTLVRVIDGRAIKIRGNPGHPISKGTICPRGAAELQNVYHPDRLQKPLIRRGGKSGRLEPADWDEALDLVASRMADLPQGSLRVINRDYNDLTSYLADRLAAAFGPTTFVSASPALSQPPIDAFRVMHGEAQGVAYDLAHAGAVFAFGRDWLQASESPVEMQRAFGELRRGRPDHRPRIVQIEPRMSITAMHADEWVPVRPGAHGAVALAMACVIVQEGLHNARFLAEHAAGFEDRTDASGVQHVGFKRYLMEGCDLAALSTAADVPEDKIRRLAREFASARPGVALASRSRLSDQMLVHALNALVGSFGSGGITTYAPMSVFEPGRSPNAALHTESIPDLILSRPEEVQAIILDRVNPAFASPSPQRWRGALERCPFVVALAQFLDESAACADVVLPVSSGIESWSAVTARSQNGTEVLSISAPAIDRLYESRPASDVLLDLAHRIGDDAAVQLRWLNAEQALRQRLTHLEAEAWTPIPGAKGVSAADAGFWEGGLESGGWQRKGKPQGLRFATPSGKFQFSSEEMAKAGPAGKWVRLPRWEGSPVNSSTTFPLYLELSVPGAYPGGVGGHIPLLAGQFGSYVNEAWETWVEVSPETGKILNLANGDRAIVATEAGEIEARVRWHPGIRPDVISMPIGLGHETFGGPLRTVGSNPAQLVPARLCAASGQPVWLAAANIRKEASDHA